MVELTTIEAKAYVPAKDFTLSKQFYQDLGLEIVWSSDDLAYVRKGFKLPPATILQQGARRQLHDAFACRGRRGLVEPRSSPRTDRQIWRVGGAAGGQIMGYPRFRDR